MGKRRVISYLALMASLCFVGLLSLFEAVPSSAQTVPSVTPALVITNTPAATSTPVILGTLFVATAVPPDANPCANPLPIPIGSIAYVRSGTTVRYAASDSSAWMTYTTINTTVTVVEGPICNENRIWWKVVGTENPGWIKEWTPETGFLIIPTESSLPDPCSADTSLAIGRKAEVYLNTRIRAAAGIENLTKTVVPAGTFVDVLAGPECVDGLRWWLVQATVVNFTYQGWMAETFYERTLVADETNKVDDDSVCDFPLPFSIGQRGFVDYYQGPPKYLRDAPGTGSTPMFSLVRNVPFIIEAGPVCREALNWWKIRVLASSEVIGWMAEGSSGVGYWMSALNPFEYGYPLPLPPTAQGNGNG